MSVEDERRFDIEKDTDLSAPLLRHLGHLGYVDALEHVEPDMVEPVHVARLLKIRRCIVQSSSTGRVGIF